MTYEPTAAGYMYFNSKRELVNYFPSTQTIEYLVPSRRSSIVNG